MSEDYSEQTGIAGKLIRFYNNDFYTAIMDEDLRAIGGMSKTYGSNGLIEIQDGASGGRCWKGFAIPPLHVAASCRRAQSIKGLLSAGADTETKDHLGRTALHLVIINWPSFQTTSPKPDSKFWMAVSDARERAETCLQLLCEHGANINAQVEGKCRQTALHLSVRYRAPSAVRILTSLGADANTLDSSGMTPLHMAAGILHKDIVASLVRQGADINMRTQHTGNTPLHLAVVAMATKSSKITEEEISCISELLEKGANPSMVNEEGMSPLHQACCMGQEEVVDLLLTYGANVNEPSAAGENCLFLFLNHITNVKNRNLLMKLLSLTSPLTVFNQNGCLPSSLTQPRFYKQRIQLIKLIKQPKTLKALCKSELYLKYVGGRKEELKRVLPESLYDFVFDQWEIQHFSFVDDYQQDVV